MRTLRLTSAHRTCYLATAFVTLVALQLMEGARRERVRERHREESLSPAAPAPVMDVLDLVRTLKDARTNALATDDSLSASPASDASR